MKLQYRSYFSIFLFLICNVFYAQEENSKIDSLISSLVTEKNDTLRAKAMVIIGGNLYGKEPKRAEAYYRSASVVFIKYQQYKNLAESYSGIGTLHKNYGNLDSSLIYHNKSLELHKKIKNFKGVSTVYNNLGITYKEMGEYGKALWYCFEALKLIDEKKNKKQYAKIYSNIANIYRNMGKHKKSLEYNKLSLAYYENSKDLLGLGRVYGNIGNTYKALKNYDTAMVFYIKAKDIREGMGDKNGMCVIYQNISSMYIIKKEFPAAIAYTEKSMALAKELDDRDNYASSLNSMADIYIRQKNYQSALKYSLEAFEIVKQSSSRPELREVYKDLSVIYKNLNKPVEAYKFLNLYTVMKDSINDEENNKQMNELEQKFQNDKKQKEIEILKKNDSIKNLELKRQNAFLLSGAAVLLVLIVFAFFIYKNLREKKKANILLSRQNIEIQKQKSIIEEKNKDIIDSIRYAERLQATILPGTKTIKAALPDSFVLYKPKDIVSGDFYYVEEIKLNGVDHALFAVVDCTGHGVPGAIMSIVANNLIQHIVKEKKITQPNLILNDLIIDLNEALSKKDDNYTANDGMDLSLCLWNKNSNEVQFAGAFNPLVIISDGKLIEQKGDKSSIGRHGFQSGAKFTHRSFQLKKGDVIYLSSDGYADQFGGERSKKMMRKNFQQILMKISSLSMESQVEKLDQQFTNWRGPLEQVDDVCIIGVRL